jgi:uncharacterized protein
MRRRTLTILTCAVLLACSVAAVPAGAGAADPGARRPQEPLRPLPYVERQVTFRSPAAGIRLAGTLALPAGGGPHPAVVLVAGTGPQDRDATVAGHRPFLVLADHLVRHGIAVLRFDERGVGASGGSHASASTPDFAQDAAAAVAWLATQRDIDGARIGVIGHSEGGMVAPMVASQSARVAFLVLLAAPGLPMREIGVRQAAAVARAEGAAAADVAARVQLSSSILALFRDDLPPDVLQARARPVLEAGFAGIGLDAAGRQREVERALAHYASPWAQFALRHDPAPVLRSVRVPVLALNGGLDVQIEAGPNLAAIAAALRDGGNARVTVRELPGLNHYFQTARTGGISEYGRIPETFAPAALTAISDWVLRQ